MSEFYHYGIKGMKWGIRRTPEQLGHHKKKEQQGKEAAQSKREKRAQARAEKAKAHLQKEREKILRSPSKLYKNRDMFTKSEIDEAMRRFQWEKNLRDYSKSEMESGKIFVNNILDYADTGIRTYNTVARLYNTFGADDKNQWKIIPGGGGKKK